MLVGALIWYLIKYKKTHYKPEKRKKKVEATLRKFAALRKYKVLSNVKLGDTVVDHILLGYFGLVFVNDLCEQGYYYGRLEDSNWICSDSPETLEKKGTMKRVTVENPLPLGENAIRALREHLSKKSIYKIGMENVAVITDNSSVIQITGSKEKVMNLKGLSSMLSKSKYSSDAGLDIDKIEQAILELQ